MQDMNMHPYSHAQVQGLLQMNMLFAMPMAMPMLAMNMHQMSMQPMQPMEQLHSPMRNMQHFGFLFHKLAL